MPNIDTAENHWFVDGIDTHIVDDSYAYCIEKVNGNWFIGWDTTIVSEGRSISSITKDSNDDIIITLSDGTTKNVGSLKIDIQGDFLTSDGFGNLRYYNGHFQYYDESSSTWIDTSVTPSNIYIMNMTPQEMKKIFAVYDTDLCKYKLKFEEPDDTVINGQVACIVEKVVIRRKLGSVPTSETDGDLVLEIKRKDFGSYKNEYFVDTALSPSDGEIFYYKAFPMSTTGFYNSNSANETEGNILEIKDDGLYASVTQVDISGKADKLVDSEDASTDPVIKEGQILVDDGAGNLAASGKTIAELSSEILAELTPMTDEEIDNLFA